MSVKRKDFQKIASTIHHFLLKLTDTYECAELRDSLNLSLLQLQKYYRKYQQRLQHTGRCNLDSNGSGYVSPRQSLRITLSRLRDETLSPMTPYIEEPQYFHAHWTVIEEKVESFRRSQSDENINPQRSINTPPVHYAAMMADFDMLTELHIGKTDVLEDQDCIGRTPMMYAAFYNKIPVIKWLLDRNVNPNSCDFNEVTPLHWSCSQGHTGTIELLLDAGADKDVQDSFGRSATHWACTCSTLDPLKLLIEYGANINLHDRNGLTPAMWACRLDHLDQLKLLSSVKNQYIDHIDGYERDRNGRTIIHWSIRRQQPFECLKYLLNEEIAQLKDDEGKTVLLLAAEQGCLECCRIIIEIFGTRFLSDVDDKDRSCLHLATIGGHGEVVNYMLEMGMNVNSKDKTGATCVEIARNQYLFYCQLIISSHIREKERKSDQVTSDNVEVIANIISRHNSISDSRNQVVTPPRPPKSPKSNDQSSVTPTLKRRLQHYNSNASKDVENTNGFDAMSSDPVNNGCNGDLSPNVTSYSNERRDEEPDRSVLEPPSPKNTLETPRYVESENIDYLDNDTGQQYHGSPQQVHNRNSSQNSSFDSHFEERDGSHDIKMRKRTFVRAQKANRINSDRSDKDSEHSVGRTTVPSENVLHVDKEPSGIRYASISSPSIDTVQRINYGATLEPIRIESQLNPRRKKKRINRPRKIVTQSQDRFNQVQDNIETYKPLSQAQSLDNMPLKLMELPNGMVPNRSFPLPITSNTDIHARNLQTVRRHESEFLFNNHVKPGVPLASDQPDKPIKRPPKLNKPMELHNYKYTNSSFPNL